MARGRVSVEEPWRPLTAREFAVARLVSEGYTNAEIADSLGIAPKTASSHVEHILAKLGASRRAEIATWASTVERSPLPELTRPHVDCRGAPMPSTTDTFTGFRPEAIQFLADLAENNDRAWFTPRKAEYERLLKEPLAALCVAVDEALQGPRHPALGRPGEVAVPDLPRCPVLQGQVALQDERRGVVSLVRRRRR